jgi:hypothetical protein
MEVEEALYGDREDVETFDVDRWVSITTDAAG